MTNQPLGLPEGTVRAIFALMFALTACYLAVARRVEAEVFVPLVMAIVGYYFGQRQGNGAAAKRSG
ncbi:MAG: hypothetical protein JSV65_18850 [Armatimonadota bacterium]|nr:MAG: hypothetical protein JSV65_18850 [Armatimonadota bacterium]